MPISDRGCRSAVSSGKSAAELEKENAQLKTRVAQLEAELASRPSEGVPPAAGFSSSSIAKKVEESRRARERLAALLNLPDEN